MNILIHCSNLKAGGGIQVADSICCLLNKYAMHNFVVVLSSRMKETKDRISGYINVSSYIYDVKNNFHTLVFGRDRFLDGLVNSNDVKAVLTVFGPSRWNPQVYHLSGWAIPHPLLPDSPYFSMLSFRKWCEVKFKCVLWRYMFGRSTDFFWTENPLASSRVRKIFPNKTVYSVTNYYNQIYDYPDNWKRDISLPLFKGITCLTITANYPHKNLRILIKAGEYLKNKYPEFSFRFVLTVDDSDYHIPTQLKDNFVLLGRVDVTQCPNLYEQSDIMVMPSLLECFTATYPEAMKMGKPIITTDLEFAKGLCGEAAYYYSALDAKALAEAVYLIATNNEFARKLTENGKRQLLKYDNYEQRADRLIKIIEDSCKEI